MRGGRRRLKFDGHALRADKMQRERASEILGIYSKQEHHGHRFVAEDSGATRGGCGQPGA
jgi:uncharacterized protein (DUF2252 family)